VTRLVPSEDEVVGWMSSLSNWGRWGADDELGTLNLITREKRLEAIASATEGVAVSCARDITTSLEADQISGTPQR
jgi:hypothetical protein